MIEIVELVEREQRRTDLVVLATQNNDVTDVVEREQRRADLIVLTTQTKTSDSVEREQWRTDLIVLSTQTTSQTLSNVNSGGLISSFWQHKQ